MRTMIVIIALVMLLVVYLYNRYSYKKRELRFPPAGKFVRVNGLPVHYLDEGEGRPIVFLHGGGEAGSGRPFLERTIGVDVCVLISQSSGRGGHGGGRDV